MIEKIASSEKIEEFLVSITETDEYKDIEYLIFSIRKRYLNYLSSYRTKQFEIPGYLKPLVDVVIEKFNNSGILTDEMLKYMLHNDINGWIRYYVTAFINPARQRQTSESIESLDKLFALILTGYILDTFGEHRIDIQKIISNEKLIYETNQYGLSIVNGVEFKRDYFVYDGKAYLYNILTNTKVINFADTMPGFAKIITEKVKSGDILLRLDERLALPINQAISYSTLDFERFYGPQFHFKDSVLEKQKTITVHINEQSLDKLLMVIKKDYNQERNEQFWHIEIEKLPYKEEKTSKTYCKTTFLHGIYFPENDYFTHIDCAINQYPIEDYLKKYSEENDNIMIDLHTKKELHYKLWGIENGKYSREVWYELMLASLEKEYQILLDEILE